MGELWGIFLLRISLVFCGYRDGVRKLREFLAVLFDDFALAGMYKLLWG